MQFVFYLLIYPVIWLFSVLPFKLLYGISDLLSFFVYRVFGYRKKTVRKNLALAFPDKTPEERKKIEKNFYTHFTDLIMEMMKAFRMSPKQMQERMKFINPELLNKFAENNKNVVLVGGHYGNWEWIFYLAQLTKARPVGTYLKINNPYFEKFMLKNRKRFGGELIETKQLRKTLKEWGEKKQLFLLGLLADQSPQWHKSRYWRKFFNRLVPVHVGPEELAKEYDAAVVFLKIKKRKRGFYEAEFIEITPDARRLPDYQITDKYIELLENQIKEDPRYYLWTHNRFKHQNKLEERKRRNNKLVIKE